MIAEKPYADEISNINCRLAYRQAFPGQIFSGELPLVDQFLDTPDDATTLYDLSDPG